MASPAAAGGGVPAREESAAWARSLGVSTDAVLLVLECDTIDLHIDSFIWTRLFGYELRQRHPDGYPFAGALLGHADSPRIAASGMSGAVWIVTTNPLRSRSGMARVTRANIEALASTLESSPVPTSVVRSASQYAAARAEGRHAAFIGVQGANALVADPHLVEGPLGDLLTLVTLVHLSSSSVGVTSSPLALGHRSGLGVDANALMERLAHKRILVDLAHINPPGFWGCIAGYDPTLPLIVSHTGVGAVHPHWRNLDDAQIRAVAERGGVVGIMFHAPFLSKRWRTATSAAVVDHIAHVIDLVGDEFVALGSDWDGAILPPHDLRSCLTLPRLVQRMLDRGWEADRIRRVLGGNFLRVLAQLRP